MFAAPREPADHAARACRAAVAMQRRLGELNQASVENGLPRVAIGIGVKSGAMSVGNMGSLRRKNYTVVGDAVNLGARLEALTRLYDVDILVGECTRALAGEAFEPRELDQVPVRGKDRPERVYELVVDAASCAWSSATRATARRGSCSRACASCAPRRRRRTGMRCGSRGDSAESSELRAESESRSRRGRRVAPRSGCYGTLS